MVGRCQEIAELSALFADCAQGTGRAILISGPLACGRTELLHAFAEEMAKEDALLLQATASEAEQSLPWAVMSQLLDSVDRPHPALDAALSSRGRDQGDDAEASAVVVHGVCRAILELSHERPVVVSIDDVQHIDRPSLLRNGRFRHPAARKAVLDALDPTERARLHLRVAELLRESGAGPPEIAEHLILSGPARWEWEIPVLREDAEQALTMDGYIRRGQPPARRRTRNLRLRPVRDLGGERFGNIVQEARP